MGFSNGTPTISTDGLVFAVDPANQQSYVSGNSTCTSLIGSLTGSLFNDTSGSLGSPKAWEFDGVDSYIDIGMSKPPELNFTGDMSISAWFNTDEITLRARPIVADCNVGGTNLQFCVDINRVIGKVTVLSDNILILTSAISLSVSTWYHVVMTRAGSLGDWDYVLYINGLESNGGTVNTAGNPQSQQGCAIGRFGNFSNFAYLFNGKISTVGLYNKALSATESLQNYNATKERFT